MWISTIIGSVIFRILRETSLNLAFSIPPDPYNEIESSTLSFPVAHTQIFPGSTYTNGILICTVQNDLNSVDKILLIGKVSSFSFLALILCNLNYLKQSISFNEVLIYYMDPIPNSIK